MMESCPSHAADGREQLEVDDRKRDFSSEFGTLLDSQNSCVEERELLQVYLRVRPFTSAESSTGEAQDCVAIEPPDTVLLKPPSSSDKSLPHTGQRFQFSQVYGPETTQREMFEGTVKDLVGNVLEGGNSLVFTYGVTNAGKTFTFLGPDADAGILPRSLDVIFSGIGERVFAGTSIKPHRCREFTRLSAEQQAEEAAFKKNLLRQLKENERSNVSLLNSTNKTLLEGGSVPGPAEDKLSPEAEANAKFSVWVSFCEIYNENIHDLLEVAPSAAPRRTVLRLSQDVKGNAFVKDLRWVQVSSAEEACAVMKLGKRNQSFSSTRLNQLSSRSHSIFSVRILKMEDVGTPRVHAVSELCLCDLAGSERCAKTQNKGDRLKEAGNINTSLLILGKCINALRHNQQAKLLQHVPFRESKLTRYLQGFFCGRGRACMIVNVNQCASAFDETLNVLKFSAVAQKVVVLPARTAPAKPKRSAAELSFGSGAETKAARGGKRRSSLNGWESSLEDVQEGEADEEGSGVMEDTADRTAHEDDSDEEILVGKKTFQRQEALVEQLQMQLKKERAESLLMEARVREETSREFSELFSEMQSDYTARLGREREMLEERAERRLEIFKNLIDKMAGANHDADSTDKSPDSCSPELAGIREAARKYLGLDRTVPPEREGSELSRQKAGGGEEVEEEQQQKSSETERPERRAEELQGGAEEGRSQQGDQLREAMTALQEEKRARGDALAALERQTAGKEEALASLAEERKSREEALASLEAARRSKEEALAALAEAERGREEALAALAAERSGREEAPDGPVEEREERQQEVEVLQQEVRELSARLEVAERQATSESAPPAGRSDAAQEEASHVHAPKREPAEERSESRILELESELERRRQLDQENERRVEELRQREEASGRALDELRSELQRCERASGEEAERLRAELEERTRASEKRAEELEAKLREEEATSRQLSGEKEAADRLLDDLRREFGEREQSGKQLRAELDGLRRLNSDLRAEVASLRAQLSGAEEKTAASEKASAELREERRRWEEEVRAARDALRGEAERHEGLLATEREAAAQRDEEIRRLKETAKQDSEKVQSLGLELRRNEEDTSDLREKLADYKKQVQQVQKEISAMREEERASRQKLADAERAQKQLQSDLAGRDRTIQHLRLEQSRDRKSSPTRQLQRDACKDLQAKERVIEDMRLALTEQEETQAQMEEALEERLGLVRELSDEVEALKGRLLQQDRGRDATPQDVGQSHDLALARQEAARAEEALKLCTEKHQAERRKWLEEKLSLIGQAKEAEEKRNQEMRKFAEDRERHARQQSQLDALTSQLAEKEQTMQTWRTERDTLVAALEVQLKKLLSSQAEKDELILQLRRRGDDTRPPPEVSAAQRTAAFTSADDGGGVAALQAALRDREADVRRLQEELEASRAAQVEAPAAPVGKPRGETGGTKSGGAGDARASVSSQGSAGGPSVLDSSEISTENGRTSRFPRPELEISFSPLQPNRVALRRQGEEGAVTVKITRSARKRKSGEMEKSHIFRRSKRRAAREEEVEAENRRNTRTKLTPKLTPHQEENSSPAAAGRLDPRGRKEGALQKIGDFLQSSPTLLGSKAKKMMSLVSGRGEADSSPSSSSSSTSSSTLSLRSKQNKRKPYRPEISLPMDMPSHPIISREPEERDGDRQTITRRLRSRLVK